MRDEQAGKAEAIARHAHAGQLDKSGADYIGHPARVAALVGDDDTLQAVAWLHDVVEDTPVTAADLAALFAPEVVEAVLAITRRDGEASDDYYARVKANPLALAVKAADLADNTDPARTAQLPDDLRARLAAKYEHARTVLGV